MEKATTLLLVFLLIMSVSFPKTLSLSEEGCYAGPYKKWPKLYLGVLKSVKESSVQFEYNQLKAVARSVNSQIEFLKTKVDDKTRTRVFTDEESEEYITEIINYFARIVLNSGVKSEEFKKILNLKANKYLKEEFYERFGEKDLEEGLSELAAFVGLTLEETVEKIPARDLTSEGLFEQFIKDLDDEDFASDVLETIRMIMAHIKLEEFSEGNLKRIFGEIYSNLAVKLGLTESVNKLQLNNKIRELQLTAYDDPQKIQIQNFIKDFVKDNKESFKKLFKLMKEAEKKEIDQDTEARKIQEENDIISMFKLGGYGKEANKFNLAVGGDSLRAEKISDGRFLFDVRDYQGHGFKGSLIKTIVDQDKGIVGAKGTLTKKLGEKDLTDDEIKSALEDYVKAIDKRLYETVGSFFWGEIAIAFQKDEKLYYVVLTQDPFLTFENGEIKYNEKPKGSLNGVAHKTDQIKAYSIDFKNGALAFLYTDGVLDAAWSELFTALTPDVYSKAGFFKDFDITNPELMEEFKKASKNKIDEKDKKIKEKEEELREAIEQSKTVTGLQKMQVSTKIQQLKLEIIELRKGKKFFEESQERFEDMISEMSFDSDKVKEFLKELWENQKNLLSDYKEELMAKGLKEEDADAEIEKILKENFVIAGSNIREIGGKEYDLGVFPFLVKKYPNKELISKVKEIYALLRLSEHDDDVSLMVIEAPRKIPEDFVFEDIVPNFMNIRIIPKKNLKKLEEDVTRKKLGRLRNDVKLLMKLKNVLDEENRAAVVELIGRILGVIKHIQEKKIDSVLVENLKEESVNGLLKKLNKGLTLEDKERVLSSVKDFNKHAAFKIEVNVIEKFLEAQDIKDLIDKLKESEIC
ncbi:hypothetical protein DRQ29_00725 [bacterium]|nr:MAG: hypothetical protein DRQ29_00725 [bacterium]